MNLTGYCLIRGVMRDITGSIQYLMIKHKKFMKTLDSELIPDDRTTQPKKDDTCKRYLIIKFFAEIHFFNKEIFLICRIIYIK